MTDCPLRCSCPWVTCEDARGHQKQGKCRVWEGFPFYSHTCGSGFWCPGLGELAGMAATLCAGKGDRRPRGTSHEWQLLPWPQGKGTSQQPPQVGPRTPQGEGYPGAAGGWRDVWFGPWLTVPVMLSWGKKKRISSRHWGTWVAGEETQVREWQRGAQLWVVHAEQVRKGLGVGASLVLPKGPCICRQGWHSWRCWREHG